MADSGAVIFTQHTIVVDDDSLRGLAKAAGIEFHHGELTEDGISRAIDAGPSALTAPQEAASGPTDAQIAHMVNRFLQWRLPEHFNPDCGISFKRDYNNGTESGGKYEPVGTNLFDAVQAAAMVRHMLEGMPS